MAEYLSDKVKRLPIAEVVQRYGFTPNRSGFIVCPFHEDKNPSLKLDTKKNYWKCFGCGKGGSNVDFVMNLYGLNFMDAVNKLASDFGISGERYNRADVEKRQEEREAKKKAETETNEKFDLLYDALWTEHQKVLYDKDNAEPFSPEWEYAMQNEPWETYFFDIYPDTRTLSTEEKKKVIEKYWDKCLPIMGDYADKILTQQEEAVQKMLQQESACRDKLEVRHGLMDKLEASNSAEEREELIGQIAEIDSWLERNLPNGPEKFRNDREQQCL